MKCILKSKVVMIITIFTLLITVLMIPSFVKADDNIQEGDFGNVSPQWDFLWICDNFLERATNKTKGLYIYGSTKVYSGRAGVDIQLEKYVESVDEWVYVPTYCWDHLSDGDYAEIAVDDVSVSSGVYRFYIIHTAYTTSGIERESELFYSNQIRIP